TGRTAWGAWEAARRTGGATRRGRRTGRARRTRRARRATGTTWTHGHTPQPRRLQERDQIDVRVRRDTHHHRAEGRVLDFVRAVGTESGERNRHERARFRVEALPVAVKQDGAVRDRLPLVRDLPPNRLPPNQFRRRILSGAGRQRNQNPPEQRQRPGAREAVLCHEWLDLSLNGV